MKVPTLTGAALVFRYQMRRRNALHDLGWSLTLLGLLLAVSAGLQAFWQQVPVYNSVEPRFLLRWLTLGAVGASFLFLPLAAVVGARAVPTTAEFEVTQSALLSRLTPFDLVEGRLMAALWPLISALLASCAFWLAAQLVWRFVPGPGGGYLPILIAHLTLLLAVQMVGAVGFLFATKRRPGQLWGRGTVAGLFWTAACLGGVLLLDPVWSRLNAPARLIEVALMINPAVAAATAFGMDVLRSNWLYDRTVAPQYPFLYPAPLASAAFFLAVSLVAKTLATVRLDRAYR
jgi:hypothetical protein